MYLCFFVKKKWGLATKQQNKNSSGNSGYGKARIKGKVINLKEKKTSIGFGKTFVVQNTRGVKILRKKTI